MKGITNIKKGLVSSKARWVSRSWIVFSLLLIISGFIWQEGIVQLTGTGFINLSVCLIILATLEDGDR